MQELNRLLQTLCDAEIEFVVVGGFAAMLHGSSMLTRDIDVCTVLSDASVQRLRSAFAKFHPVHRHSPQRLSFLENPEPGVAVKSLYLQTDLGPVDLLGSITGFEDIAQIRQNAVRFELFGRSVLVISRDDLIRTKEALGRPKDLMVAQELRAISEKLDKP